MELTKDSIVACFEQGIEECRSIGNERTTGWVVCDEKDSLPIRTDGKALHFFGGKVFVANSAHYANSVKIELNGQAVKHGSNVRLVVQLASIWAEQRIAVLEKILADCKANMKS